MRIIALTVIDNRPPMDDIILEVCFGEPDIPLAVIGQNDITFACVDNCPRWMI